MFSGPFPGIAPAIESGTIRDIFLSHFLAVVFVKFGKLREDSDGSGIQHSSGILIFNGCDDLSYVNAHPICIHPRHMHSKMMPTQTTVPWVRILIRNVPTA